MLIQKAVTLKKVFDNSEKDLLSLTLKEIIPSVQISIFGPAQRLKQ